MKFNSKLDETSAIGFLTQSLSCFKIIFILIKYQNLGSRQWPQNGCLAEISDHALFELWSRNLDPFASTKLQKHVHDEVQLGIWWNYCHWIPNSISCFKIIFILIKHLNFGSGQRPQKGGLDEEGFQYLTFEDWKSSWLVGFGHRVCRVVPTHTFCAWLAKTSFPKTSAISAEAQAPCRNVEFLTNEV